MPELPDIEDYLRALRTRVLGVRLTKVRVTSFALLRTYDPPLSVIEGEVVTGLRRLGKRIVFAFDDIAGEDEPVFAVLHLMIAGRLRWKEPGAKPPGKVGLAAFDFAGDGDERPAGTLILTEQGTKKRASLHLVRGEDALAEHDRGGIEPLDADLAAFSAAITRENRTLKRGLTDPRILSGIGNAFSDEILHRARLSPVKRTQQLSDDELARLHAATQEVLTEWVAPARRGHRRGLPRQGHRVPPGVRHPRPVRGAVPGLRHPDPAHPLRRQRDQLLPPLPDRRQAPRRPEPVTAAEGRLAPHHR